jgi:hypothetical protein
LDVRRPDSAGEFAWSATPPENAAFVHKTILNLFFPSTLLQVQHFVNKIVYTIGGACSDFTGFARFDGYTRVIGKVPNLLFMHLWGHENA